MWQRPGSLWLGSITPKCLPLTDCVCCEHQRGGRAGRIFSLTHSQALTKSGAGAVSHGTQANSSKLFCKFITALAPQKCERGQDHSGFVLFLSYIQVFTSPEGFAVLAGLCDVKC